MLRRRTLLLSAGVRIEGCARVTVFPLEGLTVAYTTRSGDGRGLGEVGVVAVAAPGRAGGEELWRMAVGMFARPPSRQAQARWILTQAVRARVVAGPAQRDLCGVGWSAELDRRVELEGMFANHVVLETGRIVVDGGVEV